MKNKKKYTIDVWRKTICCGNPEDYACDYYLFTEKTYAVSEKQAINNVRYRIFGKNSSWWELPGDALAYLDFIVREGGDDIRQY